MPVVRHTESRRSETPNAVMTTLASPSQGGAGQSVWRVDMRPGSEGPPHTFTVEQVWTALAGAADVELDGETLRLEAGDTAVLPAGVPRQVRADRRAGLAAIVAAPAGGQAYRVGEDVPVTPAWVA